MIDYKWSTENECEDCGMSWDDPNHQIREVICDECGYEVCACDHSYIVCEDCSDEKGQNTLQDKN